MDVDWGITMALEMGQNVSVNGDIREKKECYGVDL